MSEVASLPDSTYFEAFERVFSERIFDSDHFRERLRLALHNLLITHESRWRNSPKLLETPHVLERSTSELEAHLLNLAETNPLGVRDLVAHYFVGWPWKELSVRWGQTETALEQSGGMTFAAWAVNVEFLIAPAGRK